MEVAEEETAEIVRKIFLAFIEKNWMVYFVKCEREIKENGRNGAVKSKG